MSRARVRSACACRRIESMYCHGLWSTAMPKSAAPKLGLTRLGLLSSTASLGDGARCRVTHGLCHAEDATNSEATAADETSSIIMNRERGRTLQRAALASKRGKYGTAAQPAAQLLALSRRRLQRNASSSHAEWLRRRSAPRTRCKGAGPLRRLRAAATA